jgi:hypothetical protein
VTQPTPTERLFARLSHLPDDGVRALEGALERAHARARITGLHARVSVEFEVSADGLIAVELTARYERRP